MLFDLQPNSRGPRLVWPKPQGDRSLLRYLLLGPLYCQVHSMMHPQTCNRTLMPLDEMRRDRL